MKFTRIFSLIVPLAAICLLGLLVAQVVWFKDAYHLKEDQFQSKVFVLLNEAGDALVSHPQLRDALLEYLHSNVADAGAIPIDDDRLSSRMSAVLDSVFTANDLSTQFYYGIYKTEDCVEKELFISDNPLEATCDEYFQVSQSLICFLPGEEDIATFHLGVSFPNKSVYLLKQLAGMLGLSLLFILLLSAIFGYMLHTVRRQKKLSEIKNDFINNLTHEFKTPIASIALAAKVLGRSASHHYNADEAKCLQLITKESKRLENHVDNVLQMALLDSGNFALDKRDVDLHTVIYRIKESFELLLKEKKGTLQLLLNAKNPVVEADPSHVFNVLYNLMDNAIKYARGNPEIEISTEDVPDGLRFQVSDNGLGMDADVQRNIFEKFYRATSGNVHEVKGFGLGLSYVKSIIDAHKGKISFTSDINQGTRFTIQLPSH